MGVDVGGVGVCEEGADEGGGVGVDVGMQGGVVNVCGGHKGGCAYGGCGGGGCGGGVVGMCGGGWGWLRIWVQVWGGVKREVSRLVWRGYGWGCEGCGGEGLCMWERVWRGSQPRGR